MPEFSIEHCPSAELTPLPNKKVVTFDKHVLELGSLVYFRYSALPVAHEYVVISDKAVKQQDGFRVIVLGPRGIIAGVNPKDYVKDPAVWWKFYKKLYADR